MEGKKSFQSKYYSKKIEYSEIVTHRVRVNIPSLRRDLRHSIQIQIPIEEQAQTVPRFPRNICLSSAYDFNTHDSITGSSKNQGIRLDDCLTKQPIIGENFHANIGF